MNYVLSDGKQHNRTDCGTAKGDKALCLLKNSVGRTTVIRDFETLISLYVHAYV